VNCLTKGSGCEQVTSVLNVVIGKIRIVVILAIFAGGGYYVWAHWHDFAFLKQFDPRYIPHLVVANIGLIFINGIISRQMVNALGVRQRFCEWFGLTTVNAMGNYLGPAHFGALARAVYLNRVLGLSYGQYFAFLLASYAVMLTAVGTCGLVFFAWGSNQGLSVQSWFWAVCVFFCLGVPLLCRFFGRGKFLARLSPKFTQSFVQGWQVLWRRPRLLVGVWGLQMCFTLTYGAMLWVAYRSVDIELKFWQAMVLGLLPLVCYVINLIPGNLVVGEAATGFGAMIVGEQFHQGVGVAFVNRLVMVAVVFVLGTVFGLYFTRKQTLSIIQDKPQKDALKDSSS